MTPFLTEAERDQLRLSFTTAGFSMEEAMARLMANGHEPETAKALIVAEYKAYKKELFERALKREESGEMQKIMLILVALVSLIGPVIGVTSVMWYLVAGALCALGGYMAYKDKPLAGIVAGFTVPIAFIFTYAFYFEDRTTYIKIEMLIPFLLAFVPAAIIFFILSKLFYATGDHDY